MNIYRKHIFGIILAAVCAVLASPALAAGLPQLDFTAFPPQLIWLAITFVVLYLLMARIALPRIGQVIEERQHRIEDNLKKAETLRTDAAAAGEAYEAALENARSEAHSVMAKVHDQVAEETAAKLAELGAKLEAEMKQAEARITQEKDKVMASLAEVAADVTKSMTEKLTGGSVTDKDVANAVGKAMEARQ